MTVASCAGKVLLAGGYLVLDKENPGLVLATQSRIYCVAEDFASDFLPDELRVVVLSPQFDVGNRWEYSFRRKGNCWRMELELSGRNPFVETAIHTVVVYSSAKIDLLQRKRGGIKLTILADNDFYSQTHPNPPRWHKLGGNIKDAPKTGLGSSAALTSSLVAAFSTFLLSESRLTKDELHNLSQYAHCLAQGKIGSGFDVSAAIYGSQIYNRFDPSCLASVLGQPLDIVESQTLSNALIPSSIWSTKGARVKPLELPPLVTLLLAEVSAGSHTPSLVGNVLKWRQANPDVAGTMWRDLNTTNQEIARTFQNLCEQYAVDSEKYTQEARGYLQTQSASSSSQSIFSPLQKLLSTFRNQMKAMGEAAGVEIEPDQQTALLDATCRLPGVLGGAVPGAGGFDAIYVLVLTPGSKTSAVDQVENLWRGYKEMQVTPLSPASRVYGKGVSSNREQSGVWIGAVDQVEDLGARLRELSA